MRATIAACVVMMSCGVTEVPPILEASSPQYLTSQGFVVHEWGTLTNVVGSDGLTLDGLHHEEEDLPGFVLDRLKYAGTHPERVEDGTNQKMETPVTYFYSPNAMKVSARVDFPSGVLTQWFPDVQSMSPPMFWGGYEPVKVLRDCSLKVNSGGSLDWGTFDVLAPKDAAPLFQVGESSWGFAREVAANTLAIGAQREKFLFYRGLGAFQLPAKVKVSDAAVDVEPNGPFLGGFLIQVTAQGAGFVRMEPGQRKASIPAATSKHDVFVKELGAALQAALVADGLYTDEARAMVRTWERSYFLTPGIRMLYLLPQAETERVIPLKISPAPNALKRTMVIRLELLTPSYEKMLSVWLTELSQAPTSLSARNKFRSLGRFAQPHLMRAVSMTQVQAERDAAAGLITEIEIQRRWTSTAVE